MINVLAIDGLISPEVRSQMDRLAMSAGYALSTWTQIEYYISLLFQNISGIADEETALILMSSIISFDARLTVIDTVFSRSAHSDDFKLIWERLSSRIRVQARQRNQVAHFQIISLFEYGKPGGPQAVFVPFHTPADAFKNLPKRLTIDQIVEMRNTWQHLANAAQWLNRQVEPPKPYFTVQLDIPEPPLINELRLSAAQSRRSKQV